MEGTGANPRPEVLQAVERVWGFTALRPLQHEAIDAALEMRDALVVMPTGGGKSLCYQTPPLVTGEMTVVVSPLISLMQDQVDGLILNGYPAAALHSGRTDDEQAETRRAVEAGEVRLLFVSPERLLSNGFTSWLRRIPGAGGAPGVRRFAIDEAHCISHWGHDFRTEYRRLAMLRREFPGACVHAFTATATERVRDDIVGQLHLQDPARLVGTFDRPNLVYRIVPRVQRDEQIAETLARHRGEASIVYCISRRDTETVAHMLEGRGFHAAAYHAGLESERRRGIQDDFTRERLDVVVATVAFGMGIDRSDVRCVLHAAMPKSLEAYQQETGRAGRDGLEAECVLLYSGGDATRWSRLMERSAEETEAPPETIAAQLSLLAEMQRYAAGMACRHKTLSEHFGQAYPFPNCNACDVCLNEVDAVEDSTVVAQKVVSCVARAIQHSGFGFGAAHIADVLRGSRAKKILERGHDQLTTFGLLHDVPRPALMSYINQLLDEGLLARSDGEYPTLTLNQGSMDVLAGRREVALLRPREPVQRVPSREEIQLSERERALFDALRTLRREIAEERGVPPYVVFGDASLKEMAATRPGSLSAMASIRGVGAKKLETFGGEFVTCIRAWCDAHDLDLDSKRGSKPPPPPAGSTTAPTRRRLSPAKQQSFDRFDRGESIETVAAATGLKPRTISDHLAEWIEAKGPDDVSPWIERAAYDRIAGAAGEAGLDFLKPIHDRLGGEVSYEQIRVVVAHLRAVKA